ncbi:hypothetical protein [Pseudovibrio sp. Tun.PSC04-5.I4]|uniref:hypothetical protein n=1 Tax=Pseudovibrio sp. Tun.PSC04-5.I4 TaxID=1798213 RepID=UPI000890D632|nr:hypothetical protein [Pseudovibrio sp. Tun.PSC04-5.I4]SDR49128.1 hypothetical protein SAMN04515695_6129 [Pseudovibrio sp. Tun.PSC04-5.I4]
MISRSPGDEEDCGQGSDDLGHVRAQALEALHQVKTTRKNERGAACWRLACGPCAGRLPASSPLKKIMSEMVCKVDVGSADPA